VSFTDYGDEYGYEELDPDELSDILAEYFSDRDNLDEVYFEADGEEFGISRQALSADPSRWSDDIGDQLWAMGFDFSDQYTGWITGGNYISD